MRTIKYGDLIVETEYVRPCNRKIFFDWYRDFWTLRGVGYYVNKIYLTGNVIENGNDIDIRILVDDWTLENLNLLSSLMIEVIRRGFIRHHVFVDIFVCKNLLTIDYMNNPDLFIDEVLTIGNIFELDGVVQKKWDAQRIRPGLYLKYQSGVDEKYIRQMEIGNFFSPVLLKDIII